MSLEVAEHIPRAGEAAFMHNLVSPARAGVVLSWARPSQGHGIGGGASHPNCQPRRYVRCAMMQLGLRHDPRAEHELLQWENIKWCCAQPDGHCRHLADLS